MRFFGEIVAYIEGRFKVLVTTLTGHPISYTAVAAPIRSYTASASPFPVRTLNAVDYRAYAAVPNTVIRTAVAEVGIQGE